MCNDAFNNDNTRLPAQLAAHTRGLLHLAFGHHLAGRLVEAEAFYRQLLEADPNNADALHLSGTLAFQQRRHGEAIMLLRRAILLEPVAPEFHAALGQALFADGKVDLAIETYRQVVALRHEMPDAHFNLGCALLATGQNEAATLSLQAAILLRPDFTDAINNLGTAFRALGKLDEAADCYQRVITLQPGYVKAWVNLGQVFKMMGRLDDAISCFDRAIAIAPDLPEARSGKIYTLLYHPQCTGAQFLKENLLWNERHGKPLRQVCRAHSNDRSADRKLRVGYVSPDFRDHVAGLYLLPLLKAHDRAEFEIYCYSNVIRPDAITQKFHSLCHGWRNIACVSDEPADQMIREDRIDILVDTTMHMGGNRLLLFARKPAPVQVTFCAYPGTTGLETMDYRLTDPYLDDVSEAHCPSPELSGGTDHANNFCTGRMPVPLFHYSEQSIRLPDTFWCYQPLDDGPAVGELPCGAGGPITFGCLNNFCKINDGVLALWARVMHAAPGSRLLLLAPIGSARTRVLETFAREGISARQVDFIDFQPRPQYLETYCRIDIALDPLPYNGHATSLDALWMGVPVITVVGQTAVGRAGWSQLSNLGLEELAAHDPDQFVDIAVKLAFDRERLAALRSTLRERMRQSPLMNAPRFARGVEEAYRIMWREWCRATENSRVDLLNCLPRW